MELAQHVGEDGVDGRGCCHEVMASDPVAKWVHDGTEITVLGTAHISRASVETVREMIGQGDYDAVALELCDNRYHALTNPDAITRMDIMQVMRSGKGPMVMASLALSAFQKRLADQLGVEPGADMLAANQAAIAKEVPVLLIDRDIGVTLKRIYRNVPWFRRIKVLAGLLASVLARRTVTEDEVERLKDGDVLEATFNQFAEQSQEIYGPLVDERDQYMAARLIEMARTQGHKKILAVVGAGHLKGIGRYLDQGSPDYIDQPQARQQTLEHVPAGSYFLRWVPWLIVAMIITGFAIGFSQSSEIGWQLVQQWVLINGTFAAIGAMIAAAHPLTILSAFVAAPLTSLNPTISAGVVSAAVETLLRKPSVGDFSRLRVDIARVSGWWCNRVAHTFVVFFLTGMGSVIGTAVAGYKIFETVAVV